MGTIREKLVLEDQFSSTFNKFSSAGTSAARTASTAFSTMGEEMSRSAASAVAAAEAQIKSQENQGYTLSEMAARQSMATQTILEANEALTGAVAPAAVYESQLKSLEQQIVKAQLALETEQRWLDANSQGFQRTSSAAQEQAAKVEELANKLQLLIARQQGVAAEHAKAQAQQQKATIDTAATQEAATQAIKASNSALTGSIAPSKMYAAQLKSMEKQILKTQMALKAEQQLLDSTVLAHGAASSAAQEQAAKVEELANKLQTLGEKTQVMGDAVKKSGHFAGKAAATGFSQLLSILKKVSATYLSLRATAALVGDALSTNTYELRFSAVMGDDVGKAASDFAQGTATEIGRNIEDVYKQISGLNKLGSTGQNVVDMTALTNRLAWFSDENSYSGMASAIEQSFRTGQTRSLSTQTGISKNLMESFGVDEAIKSGDMTAFISSLEKATDAAGLTEEALSKVTAGPQAQWMRFTENIKNYAVGAGQGFINAFEPVFTRMNEWLGSPKGQKFFDGLAIAMSAAGMIAGFLVDGLIDIANFLSDNLTPILTIAGVVLAAFALKMVAAGIAAVFANLPLVLMIGVIFACVLALQKLGTGAEEIFGAIGVMAGTLYAVLYNGVAGVYNVIATFVEFFANVFDDPVTAVARLFFDMFDAILGVVESVASAIDLLLGTNMSSAVAGFRDDMSKWVDENYGENAIEIKRMAELDVKGTAGEWGAAAAGLGKKIDDLDLNLDDLVPDISSFLDYSGVPGISDKLGGIGDDTSKIAKSVDPSDEDLKLLEDVAIRRYQTNVNATQLTPSITVNLDNSRGDLDAPGVANSIKIMLMEQMASHTVVSYAEG